MIIFFPLQKLFFISILFPKGIKYLIIFLICPNLAPFIEEKYFNYYLWKEDVLYYFKVYFTHSMFFCRTIDEAKRLHIHTMGRCMYVYRGKGLKKMAY